MRDARIGLGLVAMMLVAAPAAARTPTPSHTLTPSITPTITFGPSPTITETHTVTPTAQSTPTGTPPQPYAVANAQPQSARSGQRVVLDGRYSTRPLYFAWRQLDGPPLTIEHADQPLASFVVPPIATPTRASFQLDVGGQLATTGIWLYPNNEVLVDIGRTEVAPGSTGSVDIVLRPLGLGVTALTHSFTFEADAPVHAGASGTPDCAPGPDAPIDGADFAFTPDGCTPGSSCSGVRAVLTASAPLPPNRVAYRCRVDAVSFSQAQTCDFALRCGAASARTFDGQALSVLCSDGAITANYGALEPTFTFRSEPPEPVVGDHIELIFNVAGDGGLPAYALLNSAALLEFEPGPPPSGGPLGEVRFNAVADCPGTTQLQLNVNYEAHYGCSHYFYFAFRDATSPAFPLTIREPGSTVISGRIGSQAADCSGAFVGGTVVLDPMGWRTAADFVNANFSFGGVPPGDYTLRLDPPCSGDRCYPAQTVTVHAGDTDIDTALCPAPPATVCGGDCNGDGRVEIAELVRAVQIALNVDDASVCGAADSNADEMVAVDDLVRAVSNALAGCPS